MRSQRSLRIIMTSFVLWALCSISPTQEKDLNKEIQKVEKGLKVLEKALKVENNKIKKVQIENLQQVKQLADGLVKLQAAASKLQQTILDLSLKRLTPKQKQKLDALEERRRNLSDKIDDSKVALVDKTQGRNVKVLGVAFVLPPAPTFNGKKIEPGDVLNVGGKRRDGKEILIEVFHFLRVLAAVLLADSPVSKETAKQDKASGFRDLKNPPAVEIFIMSRKDAQDEILVDGVTLPFRLGRLGAVTYCFEDRNRVRHIKIKFFVEDVDTRFFKAGEEGLFTSTDGFAERAIHELMHALLQCFYLFGGRKPPIQVLDQNGQDTREFLASVQQLFDRFKGYFEKKFGK